MAKFLNSFCDVVMELLSVRIIPSFVLMPRFDRIEMRENLGPTKTSLKV